MRDGSKVHLCPPPQHNDIMHGSIYGDILYAGKGLMYQRVTTIITQLTFDLFVLMKNRKSLKFTKKSKVDWW